MSGGIVNKAKIFELIQKEEELAKEKLNLMLSRPGKLIVFEGVDSSRKTMVHKVLRERIGSRSDVVFSQEPTDGEYGRKVREALKAGNVSVEELLFFLMQDRIEHVKDVVVPSLKGGKVVILDGYYLWSVAYLMSEYFSMRELLFLNGLFSPAPDLVVYFEVPVEEVLRRVKEREQVFVFEGEDKLREVVGNYERVLAYFDVVRVNALLPIEELVNKVEEVVIDFIDRR